MLRVRGFTLLEVLVAVSLISIGLIAAQRSVSQSLNTYDFVKTRQTALWVANNQAALILLAHEWPEFGEISYDCSDMGTHFICKKKVLPTDDDSFRKAEVLVYSSDNHGLLADVFVLLTHVKGLQ